MVNELIGVIVVMVYALDPADVDQNKEVLLLIDVAAVKNF